MCNTLKQTVNMIALYYVAAKGKRIKYDSGLCEGHIHWMTQRHHPKKCEVEEICLGMAVRG